MQQEDTWLVGLGVIGVLTAVGKLLVSDDPITPRLVVGRALLGAVTSMVAGIALIQFPGLPPLALYGIGCALGIVGSQSLEAYFRRWANKQGGGRGKTTN
ncbi:hypothetical protein D8I24_6542 [Cupriavidus necator H850]|uniref:phage holin family protein n=1 Tax=Cupriavidus necator TaxID=106590 RepID=UPI00129EE7C0|nr:phage holin family protein [Cupriavidus necator]KAI3597726.1 hypothetical protein D8I24_6542 [Cupriavidus necator H850]